MSRWIKIPLGLLASALLALGTLPWWLGAALRPILHTQDISFARYERTGYAGFKLHEVQYARPPLVITAAAVQSDTPVLWLWRQLRGKEPLVTADHWLLRYTPTTTPSSGQSTIKGMADLQRLLIKLVPLLHRWLPHAQLHDGQLRGFTPEMTLTHAVWHRATLTVEGLGLAGQNLDGLISTTPDGVFNVTVHTATHDAQAQFAWSASDLSGKGAWWDQPVELTARFAPQGWLPDNASIVAPRWSLPAARLKLGAPYEHVTGDARATWRDHTFDLSLDAKAEAGPETKAPPFEAQATAHGNLQEFTLTALKVNAPFATATLSAPVTFSVAHPLTAAPAQLAVKVDLAKLPWLEASGRAEGSITVTPAESSSRQTFELDFHDVAVEKYALEKARVRGELAWPRLTLETLEVQLDQASFINAHGAIDWQTREFLGVALKATLGASSFAHRLPEGAGWSTAAIGATVEGPLEAPRHEGSITVTQATMQPMQPVDVDATWQGTGAKVEIRSARAKAGESAIELAGNLDRNGLQLTRLIFSPQGQTAWQLAAPAQLSWAPTWRIANLRLAGPASQLTLNGTGGPGGFIALNATQFDSAWLHDWIPATGPNWQLHTLNLQARAVRDVLVFDTTLTGQIAMQPRPAEIKLTASGDATGIQLKELTVVESNRELTRATGQLPLAWKISPAWQLSLDEAAPLELSAATDPDSPLWSALSAYTGLKLIKPEAKIELKGTLREPSGTVQLQAAQLGIAPERLKFSLPNFDDLTLALRVERKTVTLTTLSTKVEGQVLQASGEIPMDDSHWRTLLHNPAEFDWSAASAKVEIPDADLAALGGHVPLLLAPKGRLRAKVELVQGKFSGELHLIDATTRPAPPFSTLQEINADLSVADRTLTVEKLTAKLGGEPVVVDGSITLVPGGAPRLALGLKGKNLPLVRNTGLLVRNDIDLRALTDQAGVTRISGTVTVRDCLVLANLGALLPTGQRGVTRQPPYFAVDAEPFRSWPLAVEVRAEQSIRIRTTVFNGTASAHFQLSGTLGEPRAVGDVTVDRGQVLFPFATFTVQLGTLRLREADPFHAVVNVNATSQRRDYQLRLEATGQLPSPNIVLSSTPSLEAEEVLLMVMTGQPPNNEATATSGAQRLAMLGAYLGRGVFQDLGFGGDDRLEISAGEQVSTQGRETYEFEYKLGRRWSLTGEYDRFDNYNAGLKWRVYTEESKALEKK